MVSFSGMLRHQLYLPADIGKHLGIAQSGTQCCTGRSPCARSRSRREAMLCYGVRDFAFFGVVAIEKA